MSTLKVTNIQATGETASRAVSGVAGASGAVNTDTFGAIESNNVSSYTDRGTGSVYANLSNAFATTSYVTVGGNSSQLIGDMTTASGNRGLIVSPDTASRVSFNVFGCSTGTIQDDPYLAFIAAGDLA